MHLTLGFCLALDSALTYSLLNKLTFGIGTSLVFLAVFLIGMWSNSREEINLIRLVKPIETSNVAFLRSQIPRTRITA